MSGALPGTLHAFVLVSALSLLPGRGSRHRDVTSQTRTRNAAGADATAPAELDEFLGSRPVTYKPPRSYEFVTTPLRADDGKVRRSALRAERVAARGSTAPRSLPAL